MRERGIDITNISSTTRKARLRIGLFGGTFDPVHLGHAALAMAAAREGHLDRLIVMPAHRQPFKLGQDVADDAHRLAMCRLAFEPLGDVTTVTVSPYEIEKEGISYTYDTVLHLRDEYPDAHLLLITGADAYMEMESWRKGDLLLESCDFLVSLRPGYGREALRSRAEAFRRRYGTETSILEAEMPDISSTEIRARLRGGLSCADLLPPAVMAYIEAHALYGAAHAGTDAEGSGRKAADTDTDADAKADAEARALIRRLEARIETEMSPKRRRHTYGVRDTALELLTRYGDPTRRAREGGWTMAEQAEIAALCHDLYRGVPAETLNGLVRRMGLDEARYIDQVNLAHGKVAARAMEEIYGIRDREVLDAVSYHTTGRAGMSLLEKIIYLADGIEPSRDYPGVDLLRRTAKEDLDAACLAALRGSAAHVREEGGRLDPDTPEAIEYLAARLAPRVHERSRK